MIGKHRSKANAAEEYQQVAVKPSIYIALVVVVFVAVPLGWLNLKVGAEGSRIADISRYSVLVGVVDQDVKKVQLMLDNQDVDENVMKNSLAPVVTLITPDIMPISMDEATKHNSGKLDVELSGIYWSQNDPIATINDENYHVGEMIEAHRIVEIRKTEVVFEDPMGEKVVIYFYDYLGKPKKR
jgi:hypothetical protein